MTLECMVIADPKQDAAELIAEQCARVADRRETASTAADTIRLVRELQPEIAVVSLELPDLAAKKLLPQIVEASPEVFLIATYRELSVPDMERLGGLGADEFVAYPVDILQVYRAASRRFNVPFRRHDRYRLSLDVFRADGVMIGRTVDISEGGMCLDALHPITKV